MLYKQVLITGLMGSAVAVPAVHINKISTEILVTNPRGQKVTNSAAFKSGAGNKNNVQTADGIGNGNDVYKCYHGGWQNFPPKSAWASFDDMWTYAKPSLEKSCQNTGSFGSGDSNAQIKDMYNSIQQVAESSLVDHRFILATIIQESGGCVNIDTSSNPDPTQPNNPGLMQSVAGAVFVGNSASASAQAASITQMIIDGTQGTSQGDGLVQCINQYGNIYEAARCYNSGSVNSGNLNDPQGATRSYVNDIANRMTGWLYANDGNIHELLILKTHIREDVKAGTVVLAFRASLLTPATPAYAAIVLRAVGVEIVLHLVRVMQIILVCKEFFIMQDQLLNNQERKGRNSQGRKSRKGGLTDRITQ